MVESKHKNVTLKKLARWSPSASSSSQKKTNSIAPLSSDAPFTPVHHERLQQGSIYIIKVKQVSVGMFEGWNDDMCCFSILRSDVEPMRWSEARQLPGDFDLYDAFDECGNPPIHLWTRYLKVGIPSNWFSIFEEAKRKQREWSMQQQGYNMRHSLQDPPISAEYYYPPESNTPHEDEDQVPVTYSNTDVSIMSLNHNASIVASTNIVDPSIMNEGVNESTPERSTSIMDREQIRRHLAPGQAVSRNSTHTTLNTTTSLSRNEVVSPATPKFETASPTNIDFPHDSDRFSIHSNRA
ncbi:hypothetical protein K501DRAFT_333641 [Backusella circina FSU 941]|nr:hypothetical protein K501DRAFT_333641 [Backusella circina FSU 941]